MISMHDDLLEVVLISIASTREDVILASAELHKCALLLKKPGRGSTEDMWMTQQHPANWR